MADITHKLLAIIDSDRRQVIDFLRTLIKTQPAGEQTVQQTVAAALERAGGTVELVRYEPSSVPMIDEFAADGAAATDARESVVARFAGREGGRSVILFAHPDAEPLVKDHGWRHDPFAGEQDGPKLHGWGIADDLAGVAAAVSAITAIKTAGVELAGDVIIASTPSKRHARGVAAVLHHGYSADAAIYLHPAESGVGMNEIKAFASGQLEFSIKVRGRPPDTTEPVQTTFAHQSINALDKAMMLVGVLHDLDAERGSRVHHPRLDGTVGRSTNLMVSSLQFGEAGSSYRLPLECQFGGAVSFPPNETIAGVQAEVEAALDRAISSDEWLRGNPPELRWMSGTTGVDVGEDHPLYRVVADAISAISGITPHVNPLHTSSDIRNPWVQKKIPTVGFGPLCGDLTQTGNRDEWVDAEDYLRSVKVAAASIVNWCGVR